MKTAPTLHTERLRLRSFVLEDAADVQHLIDDPDMASTTDEIEYPYQDGAAEALIQWYHESFENGGRTNFAVTLTTDGTLIGNIGLNFRIHLPYKNAELGYWIGKPYWNRGYCTEAAKAVLAYGFREHDIESIYANYFKRNPASGRVLQKIGMRYVEYIPKDPKRHYFEDTIRYEILKSRCIET